MNCFNIIPIPSVATKISLNILHAGNFACFCQLLIFFFKMKTLENIRVSNDLGADQA